MSGELVGSYRILEIISSGGMGTVYRAEHTLIGKIAAVKVLHPELSMNRDIVNRFFNEARATTSIKHPGIVEVFDFGYTASGHAFLIMELLEGNPLSHRMRKRGAIPEGEAALLMRGVCIALAAAHAKAVVHRDLKPDNIFVIPDPESALGERTKILDFGIAKLTDVGLAAGGATRTGAVMGTPAYMSPEQCRGTGDVDFRADLYSIGCILFELVAGRPPFIETGAGELIGAHLFVAPESPARFAMGLSQETEALIMTLLAKDPGARVQSANELAQRLTAIAQRQGWMNGSPSRSAQLPRVAGPNARTEALAIPIPAPMPALGAATPPPGRTPIGAFATPAPQLAPIQPPLATKPTTLSGTASQLAELPRPGRSMRTVGLGLAVVGVLVVGAVAFVVLNRGQEVTPASMAAPPAPPEPPPATVPMSPSMPVPTPPPTSVPPPEPAASPNGSDTASQSPAPAADAQLPSAPARAVPATDPVAAPPPSPPGDVVSDPQATRRVTRPPRHKPPEKSSKPPEKPNTSTPHKGDHPGSGSGSGSASKDMLEQDV